MYIKASKDMEGEHIVPPPPPQCYRALKSPVRVKTFIIPVIVLPTLIFSLNKESYILKKNNNNDYIQYRSIIILR